MVSGLVEYFTRLLFTSLEVDIEDEIPLHKLKDAIINVQNILIISNILLISFILNRGILKMIYFAFSAVWTVQSD